MRMIARLLVLVTVLASLFALGTREAPRSKLPPRVGPDLSHVASWGYQLQRADPAAIPAAIDLLVIDYARGATPLRPEDVERFRIRPDGSRRIVLAYLSVGEAENYRFYWQPQWRAAPPSWLGAENPEWKGNFSVRFWEPGWRRLFVAPRLSVLERFAEFVTGLPPYVDQIVEAGFDGVYLDRIDAHEQWSSTRPSADRDMIDLVRTIADHARTRRPGFLVVAQNAEELLERTDYRRLLDAVAKEDLLFGVAGEAVANAPGDVDRSSALLDLMRSDSKPVFVVEYIDAPDQRSQARRHASGKGYVPLFARRELDRPPEPLVSGPIRPKT